VNLRGALAPSLPAPNVSFPCRRMPCLPEQRGRCSWQWRYGRHGLFRHARQLCRALCQHFLYRRQQRDRLDCGAPQRRRPGNAGIKLARGRPSSRWPPDVCNIHSRDAEACLVDAQR
jgi:hypothetical protein